MPQERIALVTDSTCDAPAERLEELGVHCVPLEVIAADGTVLMEDNSEESIERFYDYLESCDELPSTSMPSPAQFADLYTSLAKEGYTGIVSLHISAGLSGTCGVATLAAQSCAVPVEVVDSKCTTWPIELMLRRLAKLRDAGAGFAQLVAAARKLVSTTSVCFAADTLRNLVKGGRIGGAAGAAASLLDIKPIIVLDDEGKVATAGKVRSMRRAIERMAQLAADLCKQLGPLEGYIMHTRNPKGASLLREAFAHHGVDFTELGVRQVGAVVATHVACGCVGFAYTPREA